MWKTKELANYLGMTKNGVVYLEKRGLIKGYQNQENLYRYYDEHAFVTLATIKLYERLGFSLKEAEKLIKEESGSVLQEIEKQKQLLEQEYRKKREALEVYEADVKKSAKESAEIALSQCEDYYLLYDDGSTDEKLLYNWIAAMPYVKYGVYYQFKDQAVFKRIVLISEENARKINLERSKAHHISSQLCLTGILNLYSSKEEVEILRPFYEHAEAMGYSCSNPAFAIVLHQKNIGKDYCCKTKCFLPVIRKKG